MPVTKKVAPAQVLDALADRPGATAAALAEALGAGQSTTAKYLAALETEGAVHREAGGREAGRKLPDRWFVATDDRPATTTAEAAPVDLAASVEVPQPRAEPPTATWPTRARPSVSVGGPWGPWSASTWPPDPTRTSARPRSARRSEGRREPSRTPSDV